MITRLERREYGCVLPDWLLQDLYDYTDVPGESVLGNITVEDGLELEFYMSDGEPGVRVVQSDGSIVMDDRGMEEPSLEFRLGDTLYLIILE